MKYLASVLLIGAFSHSEAASQAAGDAAGSNVSGNEKVCALGMNAQSEQGLQEALKSCRRGDILDIGWLPTPQAMQLCDFTKAMLYHPSKGSVIACVYAGGRRTVSK